MDSASDAALGAARDLVVHTYADGRHSPGLERLAQFGLRRRRSSARPAPRKTLAMLLVYQGGASLIVAVGTHFSLVEFLDKRRAGMASTLPDASKGWVHPGGR